MHNTDFEIQFAKTANLNEFKVFLDTTFLCHDAQVALVKRNQNDLLYEYVSRFVLCEEAQVALVEMRNKEILLLYISRYKLCNQATAALLKAL